MESLMEPRPEELYEDEANEKVEEMFFADQLKEAWELSTEEIKRILSGVDPIGLHDKEDLKEVLMRRRMAALQPSSYIVITSVLLLLVLFAFFGWTLYKYLMDKQRKREEKKKLKQKKKK